MGKMISEDTHGGVLEAKTRDESVWHVQLKIKLPQLDFSAT